MKKSTIVIAGFPGVGKTTFFNELKKTKSNIVALDSDSSRFSWILDKDGQKKLDEDGKPMRNPNFAQDYLERIKQNIGKADIIFISTHADIQKVLAENNIHYYLVYPDVSLKQEWLQRISKRSTGLNDENFVSLIDRNFESWLEPLKKETFPTLIKLPYNGEKGINLNLVNMIYDLDHKKLY